LTIPPELIASSALVVEDDLEALAHWSGPVSAFTRPVSLTVAAADFRTARRQAERLASQIRIEHRDDQGIVSSTSLKLWSSP